MGQSETKMVSGHYWLCRPATPRPDSSLVEDEPAIVFVDVEHDDVLHYGDEQADSLSAFLATRGVRFVGPLAPPSQSVPLGIMLRLIKLLREVHPGYLEMIKRREPEFEKDWDLLAEAIRLAVTARMTTQPEESNREPT